MGVVSRKEFVLSSVAFCASGMLPAAGRIVKTPLMLDTKRMMTRYMSNTPVDLEYFDYASSKYLALGMPDTMPKRP